MGAGEALSQAGVPLRARGTECWLYPRPLTQHSTSTLGLGIAGAVSAQAAAKLSCQTCASTGSGWGQACFWEAGVEGRRQG